MARKPKTTPIPAELDTEQSVHPALESAAGALNEHARNLAKIDETYAVDLPYDLNLYVSRIRQLAAESALRLIEMGRLLLHIRERETRDGFLRAIDMIGLTPRFAQRAVQAAVRLGDRPALANLAPSKALELLAEDDEALDALEHGGTYANLTLDDVDRMTTRELREALRRERREHAEEIEANEEIIIAKDAKLNRYLKEKRKAGRSDARQQADELLRDLDAATVDATTALSLQRDLVLRIEAIYAEAGEPVDAEVIERIDQNRSWAATRLREIAGDLGE